MKTKLTTKTVAFGVLLLICSFVVFSLVKDHDLIVVVENATGTYVHAKVKVDDQLLLDSLIGPRSFFHPEFTVRVAAGSHNIHCDVSGGMFSAEYEAFVFKDQYVWVFIGTKDILNKHPDSIGVRIKNHYWRPIIE